MNWKPFWRDEPLTDSEQALLDNTFSAHAQSAFRTNVSSETALITAAGSGSYTQAIAGAILSTGGHHAPLIETYRLLEDRSTMIKRCWEMLRRGDKVPGWGNSFVKGAKDPLWIVVDELLKIGWPDCTQNLDEVTRFLHENRKNVFPNPSAYTATVAIALKMPAELCPWLFIRGRLDWWSKILCDRRRQWARR